MSMGIVINVIHQTSSNTQDGGTIIYIYIHIYIIFLEAVEDLFLVGPPARRTEFSDGDFYLRNTMSKLGSLPCYKPLILLPPLKQPSSEDRRICFFGWSKSGCHERASFFEIEVNLYITREGFSFNLNWI